MTTRDLVDFREVVKCACPRIDGKDCISFRSRGNVEDDEECSCVCHEMHEDDLREYRRETEDNDDGY